MNRMIGVLGILLLVSSCTEGTPTKPEQGSDEDKVKVLEKNESQKDQLKKALHNNKENTSLLAGTIELEDTLSPSEGQRVILTVKNPDPQSVFIEFSSTMRADLIVEDKNGKRIWARSDDMMFTQAMNNKELQGGETMKMAFLIPKEVIDSLKGDDYQLKVHFLGRISRDEQQLPAMEDVSLKVKGVGSN